MKLSVLKTAIASVCLASIAGIGPVIAPTSAHDSEPPATKFDLSHWKITLPVDRDGDGKVDEVSVDEIRKFVHPDYFYLDAEDRMVFVSPNKGVTTANTSNARSELRYMLRGNNHRIGTHDPRNNFAVEARKDSDKFGSIGGKMEATLRVDHVALNAGDPKKKPAYSVVVGQIHAEKYDSTKSGFGYGNEPIKIYYKKHPGHSTGSVFWTYELNLAKDNPDRRDIAVPVWGNLWDKSEDPGENGISLGEDFSYTINVHKNIMYLTFESERLGKVQQELSLVKGVNAKDNPLSYGGDTLYFKAGVYNQCSTSSKPGFWYAGCAGTGNWEEDRANGDYAQASFSRLVVGPSVPEGPTLAE